MTREEKLAYHKAYYQKNKHKWPPSKIWRVNNPEKYRACQAASRQRHKAKRKIYNKAWAQLNSGKVTAYAVAYRALKQSRMPKWLSLQHRETIERFYKNRPVGFHVDHIVPLKGKLVSGLHVPWNLQYLPAMENIKKSNKF